MNASTETLWHYTDGTSSFGPFSTSVIQQLITTGVIAPGFHLRRDWEESWTPLTQVNLDTTPNAVFPPNVSPPPASAMSAAPPYQLARNGVSLGSFSASDLRNMLAQGAISSSDFVWKEGMPNWQPHGSIVEIVQRDLSAQPGNPNLQSPSSFERYYLGAWKKYAVFTGRANRKEYWMFMLYFYLFYIVLAFIDSMVIDTGGMLPTIYMLAGLLPTIAVGVRRMQDGNNNGWWLFCPFIGLIYTFLPGTKGINRFGPPPQS